MCRSMVDIHSATAETKGGKKEEETKMWANAQRDGRPAEYRWHPLFNAAKFGCPKLPNRSQPLVGRSSPHYEVKWWRYCCLTFFSDCRYMP